MGGGDGKGSRRGNSESSADARLMGIGPLPPTGVIESVILKLAEIAGTTWAAKVATGLVVLLALDLSNLPSLRRLNVSSSRVRLDYAG